MSKDSIVATNTHYVDQALAICVLGARRVFEPIILIVKFFADIIWQNRKAFASQSYSSHYSIVPHIT